MMKPQILFPSLAALLLVSSVSHGDATDDFSTCLLRTWDWAEAFHRVSGQPRDGCSDDFHITALRARDDGPTCGLVGGCGEYLPEKYWDEGWGYTDDPTLVDNGTAYCIMAESFSVLERVAARGSEVPGDNFVLTEAFDYVLEHTEHYRPNCYKEGSDEPVVARSGAPEFTQGLGRGSTKIYDTFLEKLVYHRAKTLLHEAWHRGSGQTHEIIKEVRYIDGESKKIRVDHRYQDIYAESEHLNDHGVSTYSIDVAWLEGYSKLSIDDPSVHRHAINNTQREAAINSANQILAINFEIPTLKRVNLFTEKTIFDAMADGTTSLAQPFTITGVQDRDGASTDEREGLMLAFPSEPCGLLSIQGAFREKGDYARIVKRDVYSGSSTMPEALKYLKAQTVHDQDSRIVGAQGVCFPGVDVDFEGHFIAAGDSFPDGAHESEPFGGGFRYSDDILDEWGNPLYPENAACFLTGVEGRLQGEAEQVGLRTRDHGDGRWEWYIEGNTKDENNFMRIDVACIDRARTETLIGGGKSYSDPVWVDSRRAGPADDMPSHSCALASVTGRMFNQHDVAWIVEAGALPLGSPQRDFPCGGKFTGYGDECTWWNLHVEGDNHLLDYKTRVTATCFEY